MTTRLHRQWRRFTVLCAFLVLLFAGLVWPLLQTFWNRHSQIMMAQARLNDVLEWKRRLASEALAASTLTVPLAPGLIEATTEGEAAHLFESHLRRSFQVHGGAEIIIRVRPVPEHGLSALRADVSVRVPDEEALRLIHRLETGSPTVIIDSIRLRQAASAISGQLGEQLVLMGSMRVYTDLPPEVKKRS
ncbi:MAG TPA: hypothetical protein VEZ24_01405 [Microvirga sp.]|nr:hypothetical protein [Microvirga sp.]